MMKKLLSLLLIAFTATQLLAQDRATFTSIASGNWNDGATWDQSGAIPGSTDDVVIGSGFTVTSATSGDAAGSITISNTAILTISSGATLTASGSASVSGTLNQNGTLNIGDATDDMFHIIGGVFAVGNASITNVSGYYKQEYVDASNLGTISASGSGVSATINLATVGPLNDNINNILNFGLDCLADFNGADVDFNILEGNNGTAPEILIERPGTNDLNWTGTISLGSGAATTVTDWTATMDFGTGFYVLDVDIGTSGVLHLVQKSQSGTSRITFYGLDLTSGTLVLEPLSKVKVTRNAGIGMNGGDLKLLSDATGTGELIFESPDVTANIQRFIPGNEWHTISPSVDNGTTADIFQNYTPNVWFMEWTQASQEWEYIVDEELDDLLTVGGGYAVYGEQLTRADDFTINYNGNIRSTDFTTSLAIADDDFILVGNPFSSSVKVIDETLGLLGSSDFDDQIWIWDPISSGYATSTGGAGGNIPNGTVAQGQGYFIRANNTNANAPYSIYKNDRTFGIGYNFLKSGGLIDWHDNYGRGTYVMLKVNDGHSYDGAFVNFGTEGSPDFENNYDGIKRFGASTIPQLYLVEGDLELSIDYLKTLQEGDERVVSMSFQAGKNGEHQLAANLDSLLSVKVTLEDTKTGALHEFNTGDYYTFNASTEDEADRFLLHFMYNPLGIEDPVESADEYSYNIYAYGKAVYISNSNNTSNLSSIVIYDVMGREVYSNKVELGSHTRIPVNISNTYLIVKIIDGNEVVTQKVFIQ